MRQGPFKSRFHSFLALYSLLPFLRQAFPRTSLFIPINKLPCVFVIYCSSFSQLLNYNIWCREIQQSLPAPQVMLGPWTHSAYIVHFPTIFVPLSLHRGTVPFRNLSFLSPGSHGQFFLLHSTFSLQISLLSPELTLICFSSHRSHDCPTSGFPRHPTPIWSGQIASDLVFLSLPKSKFVSI